MTASIYFCSSDNNYQTFNVWIYTALGYIKDLVPLFSLLFYSVWFLSYINLVFFFDLYFLYATSVCLERKESVFLPCAIHDVVNEKFCPLLFRNICKYRSCFPKKSTLSKTTVRYIAAYAYRK